MDNSLCINQSLEWRPCNMELLNSARNPGLLYTRLHDHYVSLPTPLLQHTGDCQASQCHSYVHHASHHLWILCLHKWLCTVLVAHYYSMVWSQDILTLTLRGQQHGFLDLALQKNQCSMALASWIKTLWEGFLVVAQLARSGKGWFF